MPVDQNRLLSAADELVSLDEAIQACKNCFPGNWCWEHSCAWNEAFMEMKRTIGRAPVPPQQE